MTGCPDGLSQVITYAAKDRFKHLKNKTFKGHNTAGYACQVNFSPDSRYVSSGDSEGRCFFWEWSNPRRVVRTIKVGRKGLHCLSVHWLALLLDPQDLSQGQILVLKPHVLYLSSSRRMKACASV